MTKQDKVYGGSLYELAKEEGLAKKIAEELSAVIKIFCTGFNRNFLNSHMVKSRLQICRMMVHGMTATNC